MAKGASAEKAVREIRRRTRRKFSAEEKVRIVLEGLRGEESIAALCRALRWPHAPLVLKFRLCVSDTPNRETITWTRGQEDLQVRS